MTTTQQMPADSVARLLASRGGDAWHRTIAKGVRAAQRDGRTRYIGATALAYFIETEAHIGTRFEARADGTVWKVAT